MTEAGPLDLLSGDEEEGEGNTDIKLPGVTKGMTWTWERGEHSYMGALFVRLYSGDMSSRRTKPEIRVKCVQFSPTGMYLGHAPFVLDSAHFPVQVGRGQPSPPKVSSSIRWTVESHLTPSTSPRMSPRKPSELL